MNTDCAPNTDSSFDNRIEAVIVCRDYSDFLVQTLPRNLAHIDRLVVVTSHDDLATRAVCRKFSVECVLTDSFTDHGEAFNKGAAINFGMAALRQRGWILHLDADILLPATFRNMLDKSALRSDCIYGADRVNIIGWPAWEKFKREQYHDVPQFGYCYLVNTPAEFPLGATLVHKQYGYCPIGFLQLWDSRYTKEHELRYPEAQSGAEQADVQWALRWPRANRILLPAVRVYHLESEPCRMGANWNGRMTRPFTPDGMPMEVDGADGYGYSI